MDALNRAAHWLNSEHPRTPATFTEYLAALDPDELLGLSVCAQVISERSAEHAPARSLLLRQVAAMAADVMDAREHDRAFPGAALLAQMCHAAQGARS